MGLVVYPFQVWQLRHREKNWRMILYLTIPNYPAVWAGIELLVRWESVWLKRAIGGFFLLIALRSIHKEVSAWRSTKSDTPAMLSDGEQNTHADLSSWRTQAAVVVAASISGLLRGLCGAGGPPLMVLVDRLKIPRDPLRVIMSHHALLFEPCRAFLLLYVQDKFERNLISLYAAMGAGVYPWNQNIAISIEAVRISYFLFL